MNKYIILPRPMKPTIFLDEDYGDDYPAIEVITHADGTVEQNQMFALLWPDGRDLTWTMAKRRQCATSFNSQLLFVRCYAESREIVNSLQTKEVMNKYLQSGKLLLRGRAFFAGREYELSRKMFAGGNPQLEIRREMFDAVAAFKSKHRGAYVDVDDFDWHLEEIE